MLSDKDRELIGLGASIAAGCQPCTNFHVRAARIAGASDAEIAQAVNDALDASGHAREVMAQIVGQHYTAPTSDTFGREAGPVIRELVSISAAYAVNGVTDLETRVAAARRLGATDGQILAAIKIASAVKRVAVRKVEEATSRAMGVTSAESEREVSEQAVRTAAQVCSGMGDCGPQGGSGSQLDRQKN